MSAQDGPGPLIKFPEDVACALKKMVWGAVWHTADTRNVGKDGDARREYDIFWREDAEMRKLGVGLGVSEATWDHIRWMAWDAGWHASNTRSWYNNRSEDKKKCDDHHRALKHRGEISESLADSIFDMVTAASWHCANTRALLFIDAKNELAMAKKHSRDLGAKAQVVGLRFGSPEVLHGDERPIGADVLLINDSGSEISAVITRKLSCSHTTSFSQQMGFKVDCSTELKAGFACVALKNAVSFEASFAQIMGRINNKTETIPAQFVITVAPWRKKHVQVTESLVFVEAPLVTTVTIDGVSRNVEGKWQGMLHAKAVVSVVSDKEIEDTIDENLTPRGVEVIKESTRWPWLDTRFCKPVSDKGHRRRSSVGTGLYDGSVLFGGELGEIGAGVAGVDGGVGEGEGAPNGPLVA